ncbi:oxidative damage protection protein [Marinicellulosiphila megalodicopiae]|uniref:oxidative damage protection protein n=1 Tax=Marinicellulosiphila megalodicopiae TaxID=2724896 RepID=UPI003BAE633E
MSNIVFCKKLNKELEGLDFAPMPNAKGDEILANYSKQAWKQWQDHQTRLINEKELSLMNPEHRKYLLEQMDKFLTNEDFDQAEGFKE